MVSVHETQYMDNVIDIHPITEIIADAKQGKPYILVDNENRENEGDVMVSAESITPELVNFMATHARGLICVAITQNRADALNIDLQPRMNNEQFGTAFTVSVEARHGVTTGISAFDRAKTLQVIADKNCDSNDIVTPGHIFPIIAHPQGVFGRQGHTEAGIDIARLAGQYPSTVICEIMNDDGTMARLPDVIIFAKKFHLKVGTIADLMAYIQQQG